MSDIVIFPFPYKLSQCGELNNGIFLNVPRFCRANHRNNKCRDYYSSIKSQAGFHTCPYGFGSNIVIIDDRTVIFTCLNIEKYSDKKMIQKRISNQDFAPKIDLAYYSNCIDKVLLIHNGNADYFSKINNDEFQLTEVNEQKELLDNTLHELRNLNKQLKGQVEKLIAQSNSLDDKIVDLGRVKYLSQSVFSTSQLISIRMSTYDFGINPELLIQEMKSDIQIHKKFVKVAHCLRDYANQKHIRINITGESYASINANDLIDLLPYLLLDNAIKYGHKSHPISVKFHEYDEQLNVMIQGLSIRPHDHEKKNLFNRGFRSSKVSGLQGQGIGLFLVKTICDLNNIEIRITIGHNNIYYDGNTYSDFSVILIFKDLITPH